MKDDAKKSKGTKAAAAAGAIITCPECEKKFKPKTDVRGKKIKCPFCSHSFVAPIGDKAKEVEGAPEDAKTHNPDFDADPNPYGVKTVDLVPRCPNCTAEMGEHDFICLDCGYNTLTRQWGKTEKTRGITFGQHLKYLLPAIGSLVFMFFTVNCLVYYSVVYPFHITFLDDWWAGKLGLLDHESMRLLTTIAFLMVMWAAGMYCFKMFIEKPKPDEIQLD